MLLRPTFVVAFISKKIFRFLTDILIFLECPAQKHVLFYACAKLTRMEIEVIIGTYDCFIKGYSFDLISTDQVFTRIITSLL